MVAMNAWQRHMGGEKVCIPRLRIGQNCRAMACAHNYYDIPVKFKEENPYEPRPCKDSIMSFLHDWYVIII